MYEAQIVPEFIWPQVLHTNPASSDSEMVMWKLWLNWFGITHMSYSPEKLAKCRGLKLVSFPDPTPTRWKGSGASLGPRPHPLRGKRVWHTSRGFLAQHAMWQCFIPHSASAWNVHVCSRNTLTIAIDIAIALANVTWKITCLESDW